MWFVALPDTFQSGFFRYLLEKRRPDAAGRLFPKVEQEEEADREKVLICRQCRKHITDESQRISIGGAHQQTFANPHGHIYDIGCFGAADGCLGIGPVSNEFTWFTGYAWQVVICAGCGTHLGWFFLSSGGRHFYGIILDRLVSSA